jgi:hypothetical protein
MRQIVVVFLTFFLLGCGQKPVSYRGQIQTILNNRCVSCHGLEKPRGKVDLTSYESLMKARAFSGKEFLVVPGSPGQSKLYILCATSQAHFRMPPDTSTITPLPANELEVLGKWITQGAKND